MSYAVFWLILVGGGALLGLRSWATARRLDRARHGERRFLRHRRRVLRVYHRLRESRVCEPAGDPGTIT